VWVTADSLQLLLTGPVDPKEWAKAALDRGRAAWLAGRILRSEALSKATLENALAMYRDRGVLLPAEGKGAKLALGPEWVAKEKLAALADETDSFLR
jgi:hypothetical protein